MGPEGCYSLIRRRQGVWGRGWGVLEQPGEGCWNEHVHRRAVMGHEDEGGRG